MKSFASLILWIDSADNDSIVVERLKTMYPQFQIEFTPTLNETRTYLDKNRKDIEQRSKFIVICRGHYSDESKNVLDVIKLLDEFNLSISLGVYTKDRLRLCQKITTIPNYVQVFDKREELIQFVVDELNK
ncbi:hypothetical protein I4U23_016196 [Adineta vaga]|nr:hypothetical protein I4U23_016196 [Adineta vaga]